MLICALLVGLSVANPPARASVAAPAVQESPAWDNALDKAATDRRHKLDAVLSSDAKKKLQEASHALIGELAKTPAEHHPEATAQALIKQRFTGLTASQSDLLTFYVMADVASAASDADRLNKRAAGSTKEKGIEDLHKTEVSKLTHLMDRGAPYPAALRALMTRVASTPDSVVASVK